MIHLEPIVRTLRVFRGGRLYGDPYDAVATLVICGDLAYLCGMHGTFTRDDWTEMQRELLGRGILDLLIVRRGERVWYAADQDGHQRGRFPVYDQPAVIQEESLSEMQGESPGDDPRKPFSAPPA